MASGDEVRLPEQDVPSDGGQHDEGRENGKQFELMLYPNRDHALEGGNTQIHLSSELTEFFDRKLGVDDSDR